MAAQPEFRVEPFSYAEARALERELGVAEPVAVALVRRGYRTPESARAFLDADESHDPGEFGSMEEIVGRIRAAIDAGTRITVHGDYDVDGVSATAILVGALRRVGADCDWFIPDRMGDGYGLTAGSAERLAERGSGLIVTVDCGIGSADAVVRAMALGTAVIVTDHHEPGETLPGCPILHPRVDGYPYEELCGAGVAWKLASALAGEEYAEETLDLVALATVADMVPLTGENRSLVRRGLRVARRALRPGIRALCAAAGVDPGRLDEGDFGFRLGPRINAAGRLYRADAAVELLLTEDHDRAAAIAGELDLANQERRETEREVLDGAEEARRELGPDAPRAALVLAGRDWHTGVVGIAASRMVERHGVPTVLIGLDAEGNGRGSARSVPGFDLLAGLDACAEHLTRYGGHRAAAGLEIRANSVDAFRAQFAAYVAEQRGEEPEPQAETIDAIVGAESLGLGVAQQFERMAPFGMGNPEVRLLVPGARLGDIRPMGKDERHARFTLASGSRRALGVAFGANGKLGAAIEADEPLDVSLRLEVNEWNGSVEPRVVLGNLYPPATAAVEVPARERIDDAEWWARLEAELSEPAERPADSAPDRVLREVVDRRGASGVAAVASLGSVGEPLLVLACDALRRRALVELAARPARFGGGRVALLSERLPRAALHSALDDLFAGGAGIALADWATLACNPEVARRFNQILAIDPPSSAALEAPALLAPSGEERGYLHLGWGDAEINLATRVHEAEWPSRPVLAAVYRALCAGPQDQPLARSAVRVALEGPGPFPRSPEVAARCLRVLEELGLVRRVSEPHDAVLGVVSSEATELERSAAFVAYRRHCEEGTRFLKEQRQAS
jgi:single-stranded-DNA-specific exonuclease